MREQGSFKMKKIYIFLIIQSILCFCSLIKGDEDTGTTLSSDTVIKEKGEPKSRENEEQKIEENDEHKEKESGEVPFLKENEKKKPNEEDQNPKENEGQKQKESGEVSTLKENEEKNTREKEDQKLNENERQKQKESGEVFTLKNNEEKKSDENKEQKSIEKEDQKSSKENEEHKASGENKENETTGEGKEDKTRNNENEGENENVKRENNKINIQEEDAEDKNILKTLSGMTKRPNGSKIEKGADPEEKIKPPKETQIEKEDTEQDDKPINFQFPSETPAVVEDGIDKYIKKMPKSNISDADLENKLKGEGAHLDHNQENEKPDIQFPTNIPPIVDDVDKLKAAMGKPKVWVDIEPEQDDKNTQMRSHLNNNPEHEKPNFQFPPGNSNKENNFDKYVKSITPKTSDSDLEKKLAGEGHHMDHNNENETPNFSFPSEDKESKNQFRIQPEIDLTENENKAVVNSDKQKSKMEIGFLSEDSDEDKENAKKKKIKEPLITKEKEQKFRNKNDAVNPVLNESEESTLPENLKKKKVNEKENVKESPESPRLKQSVENKNVNKVDEKENEKGATHLPRAKVENEKAFESSVETKNVKKVDEKDKVKGATELPRAKVENEKAIENSIEDDKDNKTLKENLRQKLPNEDKKNSHEVQAKGTGLTKEKDKPANKIKTKPITEKEKKDINTENSNGATSEEKIVGSKPGAAQNKEMKMKITGKENKSQETETKSKGVDKSEQSYANPTSPPVKSVPKSNPLSKPISSTNIKNDNLHPEVQKTKVGEKSSSKETRPKTEELLAHAAKFEKGFTPEGTPLYNKLPTIPGEATQVTPTCKPVDDDETNINTTLVFAEIVFRHGDRYKELDLDETYPNDPYAVEDPFWKPYGCGQLRNKGKMRSYWLGLFLRKRYNGFLRDEYYHNDVKFTSADIDRCIDSAHVLTSGLYPPKGINFWNDNVGRFYQPIPVRTLYAEDDIYLGEDFICLPYEMELDRIMMENMTNFNTKYQYVYEYLEMYTGTPVRTIEDVAQIYTTLRIVNENGKKLPEWTTPVFPNMLKMLNSYYNQILTSTDFFKRIKAGPLLTLLMDEIKLKIKNRMKPNYKIKFWSGFDTTILKLLYTIKETQPSLEKAEDLLETDYNGALLIELHLIKKKHFIKVLYLNMDSVLAKTKSPRVIKICDGLTLCPAEVFFERLEKYIIYPEEWFKMCNMTYCSSAKYVMNTQIFKNK